MTYIPYLGTFFFSRYPSVALARNSILVHIIMGLFLLVLAQLGTIRYSGATRASSTSPPLPLTSLNLCPQDYLPLYVGIVY